MVWPMRVDLTASCGIQEGAGALTILEGNGDMTVWLIERDYATRMVAPEPLHLMGQDLRLTEATQPTAGVAGQGPSLQLRHVQIKIIWRQRHPFPPFRRPPVHPPQPGCHARERLVGR